MFGKKKSQEPTPDPLVGATVEHKAVEGVQGFVEEVAPGAAPGTRLVKVQWPEGAPVELTSNEWVPLAVLNVVEDEYPVCENCGERHAQQDPYEALEIVKMAIVMHAADIVRAEPGKYPELEKAFAYGDAARREIEIRAFAAQLGEAPTAEEPDHG